jgi:hypothetical protein
MLVLLMPVSDGHGSRQELIPNEREDSRRSCARRFFDRIGGSTVAKSVSRDVINQAASTSG